MTRKEKVFGALKSLFGGGLKGAAAGGMAGLSTGNPILAAIGAGAGGALGQASGIYNFLNNAPLSDEAIAKRQKKIAALEGKGNLKPKEQKKLSQLQKDLSFLNPTSPEAAKAAAAQENLPEGISRVSRLDPRQKQISGNLMENAYKQLQDQQNAGKYNFGDVQKEYTRQFNEETLPLLRSQFAGQQGSSAFDNAVAYEQQRAASKMGALGFENQMKERQYLTDLLLKQLAPNSDLIEGNKPVGFGESLGKNLLSGIFTPQNIAQGLKTIGNMYANRGISNDIKGGAFDYTYNPNEGARYQNGLDYGRGSFDSYYGRGY